MGSQTQPSPFDAVVKHQQDSCYFPHLYSSWELFVNCRITASAKFCCLQRKKKLQVRNHTPTLHQKCVHRILRFSRLWKMNHRMSSKTGMLVERRPSSFIFLHGSNSHWVSASSLGLPWAYNPIKKGARVYFFSVSLELGWKNLRYPSHGTFFIPALLAIKSRTLSNWKGTK